METRHRVTTGFQGDDVAVEEVASQEDCSKHFHSSPCYWRILKLADCGNVHTLKNSPVSSVSKRDCVSYHHYRVQAKKVQTGVHLVFLP